MSLDLAADLAIFAGVLTSFFALRARWPWLGVVPLVLTLVAIYGRYVEPYWLVTTHTRVEWRGPPLRVALLSDLHAGRAGPWKVREAVRRALETDPDVILIAGDFVSAWELDRRRSEILGELGRLRAPLGVYAILGNHDTEPWGDRKPRAAAISARLRELGIVVLRNESLTLIPGVALIGLGDFESGDTDVAAAFRGAGEPARLVLTHNWKSLRQAPAFEVAFAGHTHGGQMCLPFTDLCPRTDRFGPYLRGLYAWPSGGHLYVTRGVGESLFRARLAQRPEVALIELTPGR